MTLGRLLVVEDDPHFAEFVTEVAEGLGFEVGRAACAEDAVGAFEAFQPTLILLDLTMPDGDGVSILRELAQLGAKVDIVVCSSVDARLLRSALRVGEQLGLRVLGSLRKPVGFDQLEATLRGHLATRPSMGSNDMRRALENDEFELHWQPKATLATGAVASAEALLRWEPPEGPQMGPTEFIPILEEAGLIDSVTFWVIDEAVRQVEAWRREGIEIRAAINLSACSLADLSLPDRCAEVVAAHGADPERFVFEVTETGMMADELRAAEVLSRLRLKGFDLSLDDFGTGYSSLARLHELPFTELKIDRYFVSGLGTSDDSEVLVRSMTDLAHNLGLEACAEGIETDEIWRQVCALGCDTGQGYHLSQPVPAADFARWLEQRRP
ncbi:MAG: two-component system response regulator [Myxococcota bacterium]